MTIIFFSIPVVVVLLFVAMIVTYINLGYNAILPIVQTINNIIPYVYLVLLIAAAVLSVVFGLRKKTILGGIAFFSCWAHLATLIFVTLTVVFECFASADILAIILGGSITVGITGGYMGGYGYLAFEMYDDVDDTPIWGPFILSFASRALLICLSIFL